VSIGKPENLKSFTDPGKDCKPDNVFRHLQKPHRSSAASLFCSSFLHRSPSIATGIALETSLATAATSRQPTALSTSQSGSITDISTQTVVITSYTVLTMTNDTITRPTEVYTITSTITATSLVSKELINTSLDQDPISNDQLINKDTSIFVVVSYTAPTTVHTITRAPTKDGIYQKTITSTSILNIPSTTNTVIRCV
jgi:hypothetical protein